MLGYCSVYNEVIPASSQLTFLMLVPHLTFNLLLISSTDFMRIDLDKSIMFNTKPAACKNSNWNFMPV